ncbi:MAG TPA: YggS family pyridoxal phosphate-dependent enzyme [Pirellulales bacterium]
MNNRSLLIDNLHKVRDQIAAAAKRSGRPAGAVKLIAVTKYVTADLARQLAAAGCQDLGESRPQELWSKAESLRDFLSDQNSTNQIRWHLIGHLQRNKIDRTLPLVSLIHSGDSLRLLEAINHAAASANRCIPILIEINISGDTTKHGFVPEEVEPNLQKIALLSSLEIRGLMTMAGREGDLDQARREFNALRQLRDKLARAAPPNVDLAELSMGMSGDFEVAIEEGATIVRIGSALFEGLA